MELQILIHRHRISVFWSADGRERTVQVGGGTLVHTGCLGAAPGEAPGAEPGAEPRAEPGADPWSSGEDRKMGEKREQKMKCFESFWLVGVHWADTNGDEN